MVDFAFSDSQAWKRALQGLANGLLSRGQGQPFSYGVQQGFQNFDQGQQADLQRRMEEERLRLLQEEADARRTESQKKAQFAGKIQGLLNPGLAGPNNGRPGGMAQQQASPLAGLNLSPAALSILKETAQFDPEGAYSTLMKFATDKPDAASPPEVKEFYEGGQVVQKQWNPQTGTWEQVGAGPRWQPQQAADGGPKTSLVPFYTTDAQGKIHMFQPTASGVPVEVQLPPGMSPTKPLSFQDLGTSIVGVQPLGGQPAMSLPKDVAGQQAQQEIGTATGKVAAGLPDAIAKAEEATQLIDSLKTHPGREYATGKSSILPTIPGTDSADFQAKLDQLKGTVFLQAYSQLKGGGAITEIEGQKAEQAIARLSTAQSEGEFVKSLDELKDIINAGIQRMQQRAGGAVPQSVPRSTPASNAPAPGTIEGGYRFKGGDPANPANWEKVN